MRLSYVAFFQSLHYLLLASEYSNLSMEATGGSEKVECRDG